MKLLEDIVTYKQRSLERGLAILLLDVQFLQDFGPWRKGDYVSSLTVDLVDCKARSYRLVNMEIERKACSFKIVEDRGEQVVETIHHAEVNGEPI